MHGSRVGQAMASDEAHAYEIMKELDVDYVLVIFGGLIGYSSDGNYFLLLFVCDLKREDLPFRPCSCWKSKQQNWSICIN